MTTNIEDEPSLGNVIKIENFSNLLKLFRVTAYVLRFINKLRKRDHAMKTNFSYSTAEEMRNARTMWVKENQKNVKNDIKFEQIKMQLNIIQDEEGLLMAYGRMKNAC